MALRGGHEQMIEFLNEALKADPEFLQALYAVKVPCNQTIADHPSIQVWTREELVEWHERANEDHVPPIQDGEFFCSFLGLLNGFYGFYDEKPNKGCGPICIALDDDTHQINWFRETRLPEAPTDGPL